jgi:hypothetical protein
MKRIAAFVVLLFFASRAAAQQPGAEPLQNLHLQDSQQDSSASTSANMPGMQMSDDQMGDMEMPGGMTMHPHTFLEAIIHHAASGTSAEPTSTPAPMLMTMRGGWMLMFHANVFILDQQQSGPRGADKFFSTNWFMSMAEHQAGPGIFTARAMLSLEPATISQRQYPELFQLGETAFGKPIVDGQHPHDFFMELALLYDLRAGERGLLSIYVAPVGDPAIGPTAYPHRASASEDPLAALGHHQEDSTHIAYNVVTLGATYSFLRFEAGGFHGREPDEFRWNIDGGAIDSWTTRLTLQPGQNWSGQYSFARIASPESLYPTENQERMTASLMYNRPFANPKRGNWANSIVWGRTRSLSDNSVYNSYLLESTLRFSTKNYVWTRIENVDRSNELLLKDAALPPGFEEKPLARVQAYTVGYSRDFDLVPHLASSLGAQVTAYGVPGILQPLYGEHPFGVAVYVRFRPFSGGER